VTKKKRLDELVKKRKAKDDERKDAAKHRQDVVTASEQLVKAFKLFTTAPAMYRFCGGWLNKPLRSPGLVDTVGIWKNGPTHAVKSSVF